MARFLLQLTESPLLESKRLLEGPHRVEEMRRLIVCFPTRKLEFAISFFPEVANGILP